MYAQSDRGGGIEELPAPVRSVIEVFRRPLHPVVGGVAAGGGLGAGIEYDTPTNHRWFHDARAVVTVNKYWTVAGETGYQNQWSHLGVYGGARDMNRLNFFGFGPDSQLATHSTFRLRENVGGVRVWLRPVAPLRFGVQSELYSPQLGSGISPKVPSIERLFPSSEIPGLGPTPRFARYRAFVELGLSDFVARTARVDNDRGYHGTLQAAFESVQDLTDGYYDFHRIEAELRQQSPGFHRGHRFTVHAFSAVTGDQGNVPFYMQYALGGGSLRPFRPDLVGGDGTTDTLRGFLNYRFRDRNVALVQAEYRVPVYGPLHASVFYDVGTVSRYAKDLLTNPKQDGGFGLSYRRNGISLARIDVGFGAGEGSRIFVGFGLGR